MDSVSYFETKFKACRASAPVRARFYLIKLSAAERNAFSKLKAEDQIRLLVVPNRQLNMFLKPKGPLSEVAASYVALKLNPPVRATGTTKAQRAYEKKDEQDNLNYLAKSNPKLY